jgi:uncharacterized protein YdaU (DUF1376 family)
LHYYQFNIGDYRKDTTHLSRLEHGIYRDLIDWYYLEETPIPLDTQVVMRRLRLVSDEEAKALQNVLSDFFQIEDGYRHARIDADILAYHAMAEKNRINGKLGGRPKKTQWVNLANPNESQNNPNQEPITNNHKPPLKPKAPATPLPDWLDAELWADFKAHRIASKSKMTPRAEALALAELANLKEAGQNPADVIRQSIMRGWKGLFALPGKDENAAKRKNGTPAWWSSDAAIIAKGREVNLAPRPGESIHEFKGRVAERLSVPA